MNCKQQCFGCHGFYGDGDIASQKRSSYHALTRNPEVDRFDIPIIKAFYGRSYRTPLCWVRVSSVLSVKYLNIQASMVE